MFFVDVVIVLLLIALNGFLALSELALVSARRSRLEAMQRRGNRGAAKALQLMSDPGRFLSAVQVGITLVGIIAGAFSGVTLAERGDSFLESLGVRTAVAEPLAYIVVVAAITYLSVIAGELIPKQIALQNRERIAAFVAGPMQLFARALAPLVTVLPFCPSWTEAAWNQGACERRGRRRGDQRAHRAGGTGRLDQTRRTRDDRRRDAACGPLGARRHDPAKNARVDRSFCARR